MLDKTVTSSESNGILTTFSTTNSESTAYFWKSNMKKALIIYRAITTTKETSKHETTS